MSKDSSKKHNKYIWLIIIPIVLYVLFIIGIFGIIIFAYIKQYNIKGISNILSIYIDEDREKEYVGKLNNYDIYVEKLRLEELNYKTFDNKSISLKDAIDDELVTIDDWRRGAWYIFKNNDTEILRYETYEIAITNKECIIRPISNYKSIDINCNNIDIYRITLNKGNSFYCDLLDKNYKFKIKEINKNNIVIVTSDYGLTKVKDTGINLKSKEKEFVIEKNKEVKITTQTMDYNETMTLEWY